MQDPGHVAVVEDVRSAGQPERRTGDHDRLVQAPTPAVARRPAGVDVAGPVEVVGEQVAELEVGGVGDRAPGDSRSRRRVRNRRRRGVRGARRRDRRHLATADAEAGGVQAAQRVVERLDAAVLGLVGGQVEHVLVAEHVAGEALQGPFRAHLDEAAGAGVEQGPQSLHELHRGGDLTGEQVEHLLGGVGTHRVELAGHVGDDGQRRRVQVQSLERGPQRLAGGRHDRGVERVADGQLHGPVPALLAQRDGLLDGLGRTADDGLAAGVDVGQHDVAVDLFDELLGLLERRQHGERPVVLDLDRGHPRPRH